MHARLKQVATILDGSPQTRRQIADVLFAKGLLSSVRADSWNHSLLVRHSLPCDGLPQLFRAKTRTGSNEGSPHSKRNPTVWTLTAAGKRWLASLKP